MAGKNCTCGGRFMDAQDWRDHMPCPGTEQEQATAREAEARVLWAHLVSAHACCIDPKTSAAELADLHKHEHQGPGTIRNHDPADRSYSLKKIGTVLSESEE
jgi:hypothetical protein